MKKITKINIFNIGSFLNFNWSDSLPDKRQDGKIIKNTFGDNNIFYGDNGNGKSTLVKIFKKINGNQNIELKKNWENQIDDSKIEFFDEDGKIFNLESTDYNNKFIIFDKEYIKNNVGDIVFGDESTEPNKKRGEKIITLGGFNKKEKVLKKYDEIIKNLKDENNELYKNIKNGEKTINNNLINKEINDYESNLNEIGNNSIKFYKEQWKRGEEKSIELTKIIDQFNEIKKIDDLQEIKEIDFDRKYFENIFKESFNGVDFNYGEKDLIKGLLDKTQENNLGKCLFCEQDIKNGSNYIPRIEKLIETFSDKEKEISDGLIKLKNIILYLKQKNNEIENIHIKNKLSFNQFRNFNNDFNYNEFQIKLTKEEINYLDNLLKEIEEKNNIKSNVKNIDLSKLDLLIIKINIEIKEFNKNIKNINKKIEELKKIDIESKKQEKINGKTEIDELKNKYFIRKYFETIKTFFEDYDKYKLNKENIEKLESSKKKYRIKLAEDFKKFSEEYGKSILDMLKELNSSLQIENFEIKNGTSNYSQGAGRYGFELKYKNKNIIGELSEGEKRSIALSYFFAEIKKNVEEKEKLEKEMTNLKSKFNELKTNEEKKENGLKLTKIKEKFEVVNNFFDKILVLDDPAVDFDIGHKKEIANFLAKYSKHFKQVFIFSHDQIFFNYLRNSFDTYKAGNFKKFWIYKTKGISNIVENNKDIFDKYKEDLKNFIENGNKDITELYVLTYKLRFCIEKFIKDDLLGFQEPKFNYILDKIGNNNVDKIKNNIKEIKSIYNYCNNNGSHFSAIEGGNNGLTKKIENFLSILE